MHKLIKNFANSVPPIRRIVQERDELRKQVAGLQEQISLWQVSRQNASGDLTLFENYGYCPCCDSNVKFVAYGSWWRDQYLCIQCGSIPRERAIMHCIDRFFPSWRDLLIHESSPSNRGTSLRLKNECPGYIATQYYPGVPVGTMYNGYRCENLTSLSFEDNSIDLHVTQDVFEHVFQPKLAFKEISRTLKPGGAHIFTVPIVNKNNPSQVCARLKPDGTIEHLHEPEYHGNPVSNEGSLVTTRWGYDICEFIHRSSGLFTKVFLLDNLSLGIRAEYIDILITEKPASSEIISK